MYIVAQEDDAVVRALLDAGADKDLAAAAPPCIATAEGHDTVVRMLLDAGADAPLRTA